MKNLFLKYVSTIVATLRNIFYAIFLTMKVNFNTRTDIREFTSIPRFTSIPIIGHAYLFLPGGKITF